jgi:hypothetical protein
MLLLIGNRKFCKHVIANSPVTAIKFFQYLANHPNASGIRQFSINISTEALLNEESVLYLEDDGFQSGLLGYIKPFSSSVYGNYKLVESLSRDFSSPLNLHYKTYWSWNANQFEAFSRALQTTINGYLQEKNFHIHSYAIYQAFDIVKSSIRDVYKLNDLPDNYYDTDIMRRFEVAIRFVTQVIDGISKQAIESQMFYPVPKDRGNRDLNDHIATLMFDIILEASSIKTSGDLCWSIHYNIVWGRFFGFGERSKARKIIQFKLRRLLYDEIMRLDEFPNFKSSRILGFCLNVMGFFPQKGASLGSDYYPLHKVIIEWTRKNYERLVVIQPFVAESCLLGSITYDKDNHRLVKTYIRGLRLEEPKEFLELETTPNLHNETPESSVSKNDKTEPIG